MEHLIDTSTFIDVERGKLDINERLRTHSSTGFHVSVVTASELLHGIERAADPSRKLKRTEFVEYLLSSLPIVEIDLQIARAHAQLWAYLEARGQIIGPHDLWIAATATARRMSVVTSNVREFERVPGLKVEVWRAP